MSAAQQLRLVKDAPPAHATTTDPTRQVFEHWVFMFGLHPGRTKLDPERRQVINSALTLYDGDVALVMQAVEGMAAVSLTDKPASMQEAMREISWFLAKAKRIESCLRYAEQLRDMVAYDQRRANQVQQAEAEPADPAALRAVREALRVKAAQIRGQHG